MSTNSIAQLAHLIGRFNQKRRLTGLGRTLLVVCDKLGLELPMARRVVRAIKILVHPFEYAHRRWFKPNLGSNAVTIPKDQGYVALPADGPLRLEGLDELRNFCADLLEQRRLELDGKYSIPYTLLLRSEASPDGLRLINPLDYEPILRFVCQSRVMASVVRYLGEFPVIADITVGYTPPNNERTGSQNFHRDTNATRQLHLIVCLDDIDMESGPFTLLPKTQTDKVRHKIGHVSGRIEDDELFAVVDENELVYCTGQAGDSLLVNPHDCFHLGARARGKSRFVLIVNLTSAFEWAEGTGAVYRAINRDILDNGSAIRRLLLRL